MQLLYDATPQAGFEHVLYDATPQAGVVHDRYPHAAFAQVLFPHAFFSHLLCVLQPQQLSVLQLLFTGEQIS